MNLRGKPHDARSLCLCHVGVAAVTLAPDLQFLVMLTSIQ